MKKEKEREKERGKGFMKTELKLYTFLNELHKQSGKSKLVANFH